MAEQSIYVNLELFRQTPSYLDDAKSAIKDSLHYLSQYNTSIKSSGLRSRTTKFDVTYSAIYNNVYTASLDTAELSTTCTSIVNLITSYENNTGATPVDPNINNQVTAQAEVAKATNAEVSETDDDNSVWDSIAGFFCKVGSAIWNFIEGLVATFIDTVVCLLEGLFKLVETIIDVTVLLTATLVSWCCSAINWIFGTEIDTNAINNWTMSFIANDFVGSVFHAFYTKTGFGKWIADNSVIYDTVVRKVLVESVPWVGIIVGGAIVAYFTGGTGLAAYIPAIGAVIGGTYSAGKAAESAYAKGDSYYAGLGKAALNGAVGAIQGYSLGTAGAAIGTATSGVTYTSAVGGSKGGVFSVSRTGPDIVKGAGFKANTKALLSSKYHYQYVPNTATPIFKTGADGTKTIVGWATRKTSAAAIKDAFSAGKLAAGTKAAVGYTRSKLGGEIIKGAFGMGKLAAGTALIGSVMGVKEWNDEGLLMDFAKDNSGTPIIDDNKVDDDKKKPVIDEEDDNKPPLLDNDDNNSSENDAKEDDNQTTPPQIENNEGNNNNNGSNNSDGGYQPPVVGGGSGYTPPVDNNTGTNKPEFVQPETDNKQDDKPDNKPQEEIKPNDTNKESGDIDSPQVEEKPAADDDPNITFVNVGPKYVDVTPINSQVPEISVNNGNVNIGGAQSGATPPPTSGDVEFSDPTGGSSGVIEVKPEVTYEFESMEPTVSNPALDNGLISSGPEVNVETNVVNPMVDSSFESVDVTSYDNITGNSIIQDDPNYSDIGLGGLGLGASALFNMTRTPIEENEEKKSKKSEKKDEDKI